SDFFVSQMIGDGSAGVLFCQEKQLVFHAPLRRYDVDGVSALAREPLFDDRDVVELGGNEQLFGRLTVFVVELLNGWWNEFLVAGISSMRPKEVFASDQEPAAPEEDLEIDPRALPCKADHVLIGRRRLGNA